MEFTTQGDSTFSKILEEGEIDEPYILEFVEGMIIGDEVEVDEEKEFADEFAFHNDCLFNGVDEIITPNLQEAQDLLKRKLERVRKALERKEREKEGPEWDEVQKLFLEKGDDPGHKKDRIVLDKIRELRWLYPNIHIFYEKLDEEVTSVSMSARKNGWMLYINFINLGSRLLSTKSFKTLNIVELFVLMRKVINGGHKVNELMRSLIEEKIKNIGVEAFLDPPW